MGYALAQAAMEAGAQTVLISGPTQLAAPERVKFIAVTTAQQMLEESLAQTKDSDIFIAAAAVADYRPIQVAAQKIKKTNDEKITLELTKNPDIVATIAALDRKPFTVGFAAESENVIEYAKQKLQRKNLDLIIANDITSEGIGFNSDENAVTVIDAHQQVELARRGKQHLARELIAVIANKINNRL
jgi:phosphopantothenoylcysteine decarboxylase/phosphopantothenate--cysteine ligase